ncbi:uncharacterized protein LOC126053618 [Helicoverpa armigera]|uniref:Uncharacterized protein n=1 Tax=Helicoverpa armigera TaxID=29058 RepID=A0A2W1BIW8_HELAM|nr:uncharacterized protein LOC110381211 [Helicoverpa armigera]XP_049692137.1 uncharacterized protein LOC126053618 [Helicoverpa armigera]PZC72776.1 hypothetical protein B5X24_HaOG210591 [Helicoverpa armigera]
MGDQTNHALRARHSYYIPRCTEHSENCCKSEVNVVLQKEYVLPTGSNKRDLNEHASFRSLGEYYKKYEHDEVPVKDSNHEDSTVGDKGSLTNSELDKLELKIFKNMSQELQTDNSLTSLESNIKFFRTTVQEIFDNFYASMRDFEVYKKRFNEILAKNKEDALADMEEFIKDMIHHIMSSETLISNESKKSNDFAAISFKDKETHISSFDDDSSFDTTTISTAEHLHSVVEAYKNDNYLTDSTLTDRSSKPKSRSNKEEIFNIYLLSGNPCVQIKMNERNLLSEINIKEPFLSSSEGKPVASAENMERLAAKKLELKNYVEQLQDYNAPDREIPVKVSYAKKNIHLNEDFSHDRENEKSFMSKLCNFLCRKFRKTTYS